MSDTTDSNVNPTTSPTPTPTPTPNVHPVTGERLLPPRSGPGRPPQPYCPDCLKAGIQRLKNGAQGYCKDCSKRRHKAIVRARVESVPTEIALLRELRDENRELRVNARSAQKLLEQQYPEYAELRAVVRKLRRALNTCMDRETSLREALAKINPEAPELEPLMYASRRTSNEKLLEVARMLTEIPEETPLSAEEKQYPQG